MSTESPGSPAQHPCPKCGYLNASHARLCESCGGTLFVDCLLPDCHGRNHPSATYCETCRTNLAEYRLRRWRELDEFLEEAQEHLKHGRVLEAFSALSQVFRERHPEFRPAVEDAIKAGRKIHSDLDLNALAAGAEAQGNYDLAEKYLLCRRVYEPDSSDIDQQIAELRKRRDLALSSQHHSLRECLQHAQEQLDDHNYTVGLAYLNEALKILPPGSEQLRSKILARAQRACADNSRRLARSFSFTALVIVIILITVQLFRVAFAGSKSMAHELRARAEKIQQNLEASAPPEWADLDYFAAATAPLRNPPPPTQNLQRSLLK